MINSFFTGAGGVCGAGARDGQSGCTETRAQHFASVCHVHTHTTPHHGYAACRAVDKKIAVELAFMVHVRKLVVSLYLFLLLMIL